MAAKTLVVVESPAKAKTINKYLGKDYIVEASVGHVKDLITFKLGVDVKHDFKPIYDVIKGKSTIIKNLQKTAESMKDVLIATDPDREGEAIAWHLADEIRKKNKNIKRVLFNEITKPGIKKGLENKLELSEELFMSQQARRVMDRLIGYQVSPFLSKAMLAKTNKALSAGRVQSVALRMICEREAEIKAFTPIEYWSILGSFNTENNVELKAKLVSFDKNDIKNPEGSLTGMNAEDQKAIDARLKSINFIRDEAQADDLLNRIKKESYNISDIIKKKVKRNATAPFTTSSLQQEAAKRLNLSNKSTMSIAQKLYEGITLGKDGLVGLITYMRTDSVRLSPESQEAAKEYIIANYGEEFLGTKTEYASKGKNVQDAHEAIRPTTLEYTPKEVKQYLTREQADLYELIYNRFLASQMAPAQFEQTSIEISGGPFVFRLTGSVLLFKGYLVCYEDTADENGNKEAEAGILPQGLKVKEKLSLDSLDKTKSQTKPPARFNTASIVKELDELGIGRPSTYATIISTLQDREYLEIEKKAFFPTQLGEDVNEVLVKNFPELFNIKFTAEMEAELDQVAGGEKTYVEVLTDFYTPFSKWLDKAEGHEDMPEIVCEKCGSAMEIKVSRRGRFLGCSKYPECKNTKPLPKGENDIKPEPQIAEGVVCDCGKPMVIRESRYGKFLGCTDYPKCKVIKPFTLPGAEVKSADGKTEAPALSSDTGVTCPKCKKGHIVGRYSKKTRKKFFGCSDYPACDYITNYEPYNKECPLCKHSYIEYHFKKVDGEWAKYLKCPECKEVIETEAEEK
jgi:DNA topoisomerase-1